MSHFLCIKLFATAPKRSGVMDIMLLSSVVHYGFDPLSYHTKDYKTGICCFSSKRAAFSTKNKDWLARNQNNVSEWSDMSIYGLIDSCFSELAP